MNIPISPRLLEAGNLALTVVAAAVAFYFFVYFVRRARELGFWNLHFQPSVAGNVATFVFFFGFLIRSAFIGTLRHLDSHGYDVRVPAHVADLVFAIATMISIMGGVCWIRVVVPDAMRGHAWIIVAVSAVAFGLIMSS